MTPALLSTIETVSRYAFELYKGVLIFIALTASLCVFLLLNDIMATDINVLHAMTSEQVKTLLLSLIVRSRQYAVYLLSGYYVIMILAGWSRSKLKKQKVREINALPVK